MPVFGFERARIGVEGKAEMRRSILMRIES
jgi:hypothetical protein